jgi:4-hydroxy-3-methylbut-2-enyl diphosphate reductase
MVEIKLAQTAGFCWGVKRAIDLTIETARSKRGPVYTFGPLIHNPQLISLLESKKIYTITDPAVMEKSSIIVRTHGITPAKRKEIKDRGHTLTDATCPLVARVQGMIKKYSHRGYAIIIVGDDGHAEVIGLKGFAKTPVHVISGSEEVEGLPDYEKVFVVAQTTCDETRYLGSVGKIRARYGTVEVGDTICDATKERQGEVKELATEVDLLIVVGGRSSANTNRLASIAKEIGVETILIETEDELNLKELKGKKMVGITAGASTPKWVIDGVIEKLKTLNKKPGVISFMAEVMRFFVKSNLYLATGASILTYSNIMAMGLSTGYEILAIPFFGILSTYLLYQLTNAKQLLISDRKKYLYHQKYNRVFRVLAVLSFISGFIFCVMIGVIPSLLFVIVVGLGTLYGSNTGEGGLLRFFRIKDIPASRGFVSAVGWSIFTVAIPLLSVTTKGIFIIPLAYTFGIVYVRSVLFELWGIKSDQVMGKEVVPIILGREGTRLVLLVILTLLAIGLFYSHTLGVNLVSLVGMILAILYLYWFVFFGVKAAWSSSLRFELFLDAQFYIVGLLPILAAAI